MRAEMVGCEALLLQEIASHECKRKTVAMTYAFALQSSERDSIDWKKVNIAIMDRWSPGALEYIKRLAWSGKCFDTPETKRGDDD